MNKKGQVTIFIIIAILIVVVGASYFIFRDVSKNDSNIPTEIFPIKNFVDSCIETQVKEVVDLVGEGGGYYFPPYLSTQGGYTYYFYEGKTYFPSRTKVEEQLSNSLESKISFCTGNFEEFSSYNIEKRAVEVETSILDEKIIFDVKFPLKITSGEEVNILEDFGTFESSVRMGLIHKLIDGLIKKNYYTAESICVDCFAEMIFENNLNVNLIDGGLNNSIFVISDYNENTNETFEFIFAA